MLHSPPPTIFIFLGAQHHVYMHIQTLHHNIQYFCKFTTLATIPIINLSSPTTCTTQGSVPPSLHHSPSSCTTYFLGIYYRLRNRSSICGSRNSTCQNGVLQTLCTNAHSIFFKIFKTLLVLLPHGILMLPHVIFMTVAYPLKLYQDDAFSIEHFYFLV